MDNGGGDGRGHITEEVGSGGTDCLVDREAILGAKGGRGALLPISGKLDAVCAEDILEELWPRRVGGKEDVRGRDGPCGEGSEDVRGDL